MTFAERPQISYKRLATEVSSMTSKSMGGNRTYIEQLLSIQTELICLGYPIPDYTLFDYAIENLSKTYLSFLQDRVGCHVRSLLAPVSAASAHGLPACTEPTLRTRRVLPFSEIGLGLEGAGRLCHWLTKDITAAHRLGIYPGKGVPLFCSFLLLFSIVVFSIFRQLFIYLRTSHHYYRLYFFD